jgi:hypothetical protein
MIYTYYYGVQCHGCKRFVAIREYQTTKEFAHTDVTWEDFMRVNCEHPDCCKSDGYSATEIVYSGERNQMLPLRPQ